MPSTSTSMSLPAAPPTVVPVDATDPMFHGALLRALQAFRRGDFGASLQLEFSGIAGEIVTELNSVLDLSRRLNAELTRVSNAAGKDGLLDQRANLDNATGSWTVCLDAINNLITDLVQPSTEIGRVIGAVANGDLSLKMALEIEGRPLRGEFVRTAMVVNGMVEQLSSVTREVTRVAREVATEGKLGVQAQVGGVAGTWKDLTDSVNLMAGNLTAQVRSIAEVTTAVATGDLSKQISVDARGEVLELKNTINTMVDRLNAFAGEVTRVAREVGTDGKLGGQAQVPGVSGTWKDLTDSVNLMAGNLTAQVRNIAEVTTAVAMGDLSKTITVDVRGEILALKNTINKMVDRLNAFAGEVTRVAREVGTEGKLGGQARVPGVSGTWADLTDSVNSMASNLTNQVRNIADVTTAVARGDLSKQITVDVRGEILALKNTINTMVDQLNAFASEVTRVGREVGTEGRLGGQAYVKDAAGTWKDLTDGVNSMAANLTSQVRGIAKVVTAVARGDLTQRLELEARGEIAELAETINRMTSTLAIFAEQVITVARDVGVQGRLGGQANVPGVSGTWRALTDNVNQLAANLTAQVRAIGDVATAVTKGDLTRYITVEASGEVAALKDNVNEMIRNLKDTTQKTTEQDWLKTNLARFTRILQGQRDLTTVARQILSELAPLVGAQYGAIYITERDQSVRLRLIASYASKDAVPQFSLGEGLVGQCALEKRKLCVGGLPADHVRIRSGLGESSPRSLTILPVLFEGEVNAVIELASVDQLSDVHQVFLDQLTESIGIVINTIAASMRTEDLLQQSQSLTQVLQRQQEELRQTNERLERQAATLQRSEEQLRFQREELQTTNEQLEEKAKLLGIKNREVECAKTEIEEKAEQLAVTSKYKSEFLANMSHELRTPLHSLLILSRLLSSNNEGNLNERQVDFARTIHESGTDLLELINDILDLSKIESGTIAVDATDVRLVDLQSYVEQNFRHVAQQKGLEFSVHLQSEAGPEIVTDAKRLQQVLRNLLSNAFKFTEHGRVTMEFALATGGWTRDHEVLSHAARVISFSVSDTGIGIAEEKKRIIFEAFQQADGTTSRRYGGTGLGLSISREIARLLGGEITVTSTLGQGSTFTLYLPRDPVARSGRTIVENHEELVTTRDGVTEQMETSVQVAAEQLGSAAPFSGDRDSILPGEPHLLIIDPDFASAQFLAEIAHSRGMKVMTTRSGMSGLQHVEKYRPNTIALDIQLPDCDGWVMLDRLKHCGKGFEVPIIVISALDVGQRARQMGAACFVPKPLQREDLNSKLDALQRHLVRESRRLLLIGQDTSNQRALADILAGKDVEIETAKSGAEASAAAEAYDSDCIIVDLGSDPRIHVRWLRELSARLKERDVATIARCPTYVSEPSLRELKRLVTTVVAKDAREPAALIYQTCLHLHRSEESLSAVQRELLAQVRDMSLDMGGVTVLVVDDDVRNIFALTSAIERHGAAVVCAENGQDGLDLLEHTSDVHGVFMDIMMPEMDGYEVIRRIRSQSRFAQLPIIAVTARAMNDDREKCILAGASDYVAKPVDVEHLASILRVWVARDRFRVS